MTTINKNKIKSVIDENQKLKNDLISLQHQQHDLKHRLSQIYSAKSYELWQKMNNLKKLFLNKNLDDNIQKTKTVNSTYKPITFKKNIHPEISIIIVTYNKWPLTYNCLKSILDNTENICFEVVIIDNKSSDETKKYLSNIVFGARIFFNKENKFFSGGCNQGAKLAKGKYLFFLNNDTIVHRETIKNLLKRIRCNHTIGLVGSKLIYPNGKLQEAGSMLWKDGSALGYGRGDDPEKEEYQHCRMVDFCSGASILIKKDLYLLLGGLKKDYIPAYYEETDLCQEIIARKKKIVFEPTSIVTHFEYGSTTLDKAKLLMLKNQKIFYNKWKNNLIDKPNKVNYLNILRNRDNRCNKGVLIKINNLIQESPKKSYNFIKKISNIIDIYIKKYQITLYIRNTKASDKSIINRLRNNFVEVITQEPLQSIIKKRKNFYIKIIKLKP